MPEITYSGNNKLALSEEQQISLNIWAYQNGYKQCIVTLRHVQFVLNCDMGLIRTPTDSDLEQYPTVELPPELQF